MKYGFLSATLLALLLASCQAPSPQQPLAGHLSTETSVAQARGDIPAPVQQTLAVPKPRALPKTETYSVVVNNVQVKDLLFALARDAKVNVDIHPGITGTVSTNTQINTSQPGSGGAAGGAPATSRTRRSRTVRRTSSGSNSKRTSRTSCTKPTRCSLKDPAKP